MAKEQNRSLRIIGGKWRGRKARFPDRPEVRPTLDRVRETLFNWLTQDIAGSRCIDVFAGSGALGLEALSRGAGHVTFIEQDASVCRYLTDTLTAFGADSDRYQVINADAFKFLSTNGSTFDIAFLDAPFSSAGAIEGFKKLAGSTECYIYVETSDALDPAAVPAPWVIHRQKRAGSVNFCLCRPETDSV